MGDCSKDFGCGGGGIFGGGNEWIIIIIVLVILFCPGIFGGFNRDCCDRDRDHGHDSC